MIQIQIVGRDGRIVTVTPSGELAIAPLDYDEVEFRELAEDNTAYNFYKPKPKMQFVITGIIAKADKQVSSSVEAAVIVYEAVSNDTTTIGKILFQAAMVQDDFYPLTALHIKVNSGVWINAKTSDDDIHLTVMGY